MSPKPKQKTAILVTGMHRSGTSAVTRCLNLLGAEIGHSLAPATAHNIKGHWENSALVQIHERLLEKMGSDWSDPAALPDQWWKQAWVDSFRNELVAAIHSEFGDASLWVFKDPRVCVLLPLWKEILSDLGVRAAYVIPVRNPLEVAASLHKRDQIPLWRAQTIWLRHSLLVERETRGQPRVFATYDDLMKDPTASLERIGRALSIDWPKPIAQASETIQEFLSPELRHHALPKSPKGVSGLSPWVLEAYQAFVDASALPAGAKPDFSQTLAKLEKEHLKPAAPILEPALSDFRARELDVAAMSVRLDDTTHKLVEKEILLSQARELLMRQDRLLAAATGEIEQRDAALAELTAKISQREAAFAHVNAQIEQHAAALAHAASQIEQRDAAIAHATSQIEQQAAALAHSTAQIAQRDAALAQAMAIAEQRDAAFAQAFSQIDQRETALNHLRAQLEQRDAALAHAAKLLEKRGSDLERALEQQPKLEQAIEAFAQNRAQADQAQIELAAARARLEHAQQEIEARSRDLLEVMRKKSEAERELETISNSTIWRSSAPVRKTLDAVKSLLRDRS